MNCMKTIEINWGEPNSYFVREAFNTLRTNILFSGKNVKTILVTSCVAHEGKTTVSFEMARSLAENNKKVLLIDADLRKSVTVSRYTRERGINGLSQILSGQVGLEQGSENTAYIHVTLVPYLSGSNEYKTKPTQHSVAELQGMGIKPDIIVLRSDGSLGEDIKRKVALFCNVKEECVIENITLPELYEAPIMLEREHFSDIVLRKLELEAPEADLGEWKNMLRNIKNAHKKVKIGLVGKYVGLHDAYLSVAEALRHGGWHNGCEVRIHYVDSEEVMRRALIVNTHQRLSCSPFQQCTVHIEIEGEHH